MVFDFSRSEEQTMLVETVRQFMAEQIFPHEREVERLGEVPVELGMNELPLEMLWRDARVERFQDGTSDIQRHIISRELLRPHEA